MGGCRSSRGQKVVALIVQKYGGTSVGSAERIKEVAKRIIKTVAAGNSVVVVVSAMAKATDGLVALAQEIASEPSRREMDMLLATGEQVTIALLSMALQAADCPAISLTGGQVGIITEKEHNRARIVEIKTDRIQRHLDLGEVVVVAGFQGISSSDDRDITTLGRGGSDTSAVALAASLRADYCEIYTDVPGVYTTDPRLVPNAQLLTEITADEMLELASLGAKVLHPRAVEIARNYGVPLVVRSSWTDDPGTLVISSAASRPLQNLELAPAVDAVEFTTNEAKIALLHVPDRPGIASKIFGAMAREAIDVDLIIQSIHEGNTNDIAFTVNQPLLKRANAVAEAISPQLSNGKAEVLIDDQISKISLTGAGMIGRPRIAADMFQTLAEAKINIQMISTSEIKVSCVIASSECDRAISLLCQKFRVNVSSAYNRNLPPLPVRGVALDLKQAQIAILDVPDRPGMAAQIFNLLANRNISVDMIIQSQRTHRRQGVTTRDIAFTVAQSEVGKGPRDASEAQKILEAARSELSFGEVLLKESIAKISIVGSGMVGHPGVASKMFQALAAAGINLHMITTSEIRVSCVVDREQGVTALQTVHQAFDLAGDQTLTVPS
jgi:aspartate kinase